MTKCVYAGSFDPLTNGHVWMISQGAKLFDELVVAVGVNPEKKPMFSLGDRLEMLKEAVKTNKNVTVDSFEKQFLVNYAKSIGASYVLRGIRNSKDYEYEKGMHRINYALNSEVYTVFLIPPEELSEVSSSVVKGLIGPKGWEEAVKKYVPEAVYERLIRLFHRK